MSQKLEQARNYSFSVFLIFPPLRRNKVVIVSVGGRQRLRHSVVTWTKKERMVLLYLLATVNAQTGVFWRVIT